MKINSFRHWQWTCMHLNGWTENSSISRRSSCTSTHPPLQLEGEQEVGSLRSVARGPCLSLSGIPCEVVKETWLAFPFYIRGRQDPSEIFHLLSFHHGFISHPPALNLLHLTPGEPCGSPQQQWCETVELKNHREWA